MKKQLFTFFLIAALSSISAQGWSTEKIKGNGKIVTQNREIEAFKNLNVSGSFEVSFSKELDNTLRIKGDENILDNIITEVREGTLQIKTKKKVYLKLSNGRIKVTLPHTALQGITLSGSGKVTNEYPFESTKFESNLSGSGKIKINLSADKVKLNVSGSGKIEIQGKTKNLYAKLSGSGALKAKNLVAENGEVQLSGSGRMEIDCTEKLKATVSGSGRIFYFSEPNAKLNSKVSGSGSIRLVTE